MELLSGRGNKGTSSPPPPPQSRVRGGPQSGFPKTMEQRTTVASGWPRLRLGPGGAGGSRLLQNVQLFRSSQMSWRVKRLGPGGRGHRRRSSALLARPAAPACGAVPVCPLGQPKLEVPTEKGGPAGFSGKGQVVWPFGCRSGSGHEPYTFSPRNRTSRHCPRDVSVSVHCSVARKSPVGTA